MHIKIIVISLNNALTNLAKGIHVQILRKLATFYFPSCVFCY